MGCASCGQKYRGLRKSTNVSPPPMAQLKRQPLFKKGRRIYYEDERLPELVKVPEVSLVITEDPVPEANPVEPTDN